MNDAGGDSAQQDLLQLFHRLTQAERTCDIETLDACLTDDYIGIAASGEIVSKAILIERFRDPELEIEEHETSELRVLDFGSCGLIMGTACIWGKASGSTFGGNYRFTEVCVRRDQTWKVISSQMTPIVDAAS